MYILEKMSHTWQSKLPFAVYRKGNSNQVVGLFQENDQLHQVEDFTESGFVMAPFNEGISFYIPAKNAEVIEENLTFNKVDSLKESFYTGLFDQQDQQAYISLVKKCKTAIALGLFDKVVSSRVQEIQYKVEDIGQLFTALCQDHPTAFVSVVFHPKIGFWCTATPETLLRIEQNQLYTMALAGTQVNHGQSSVIWAEKEQEEQQYVTDFIIQELATIVKELRKGKTYTKKAGKVMHICTDITGTVSSRDLPLLINAIHPTPAVCGMPKESAREFLIQNEGYNRAYYAGYLGLLNFEGPNTKAQYTELYVNLRCMQILEDSVLLYVGGGITAQSDPQSEFEETVNKSTTIGRILV